jgi:peptidoglycan/xylan/chitin deacetylase (PgdA/CDA1 family)
MRRLRQAARRLKDRFASRALILMYHRVTELPNDPYLLAVTPKHFAEQLEVIRRYGFPMPLRQMVEALQDGKVLKRGIAVTFDDGYADNLYSAKPLLERYDIPATVFVTTGHVGHPCEFWWDELDRVLLQPGKLPPRLELSLDGRAWQWELGEAATYTTADYQRDRNWHIEQQDDPTPRHHLHRSLYQLLHSLTETDRQQLLRELRTWAGVEPIGRPTHRTLSHHELVHLGEGGLIEVGAHTVTHPMLSALSVVDQRDEIRRSRAHLEGILNRPVTSFAYPHGSYTKETLAVVREAGFACASSSEPDAVWTNADCFQLPRIVVRDWDREAFTRWLRRW